MSILTQHQIMRKFIEGLARGYSNSLVCVSSAGLGKTETAIETMKELGFEEGVNYHYVSNYITPVEFYKLLEDTNHLQEPKILILDDVEEIMRDKKIVGLLKGALWEVSGKRKVSWLSGTYKIKDKEFEFTGRIIFLLNEIKRKMPLINAIADRGFYYEINLTVDEMMELMKERAKLPYQQIPYNKRREIIQFLQKVGNHSQNITLRLLPKAYNLYLVSPNHWQKLVKELL